MCNGVNIKKPDCTCATYMEESFRRLNFGASTVAAASNRYGCNQLISLPFTATVARSVLPGIAFRYLPKVLPSLLAL